MKIKIADRFVGDGEPVFIIAEAGVNHNGRLDLACRLVDVAIEAGVDAIKFQTFRAEKLVTHEARKALYQKRRRGEETQYEMLRKLELSYKDFRKLSRYCKERGIIFLSTPHSGEDDVDFLYELGVPAFKVGSGDLTNLPFLEYIAKKGRPMIVSIGMGTLEEVEDAVKVITKYNKELILLQCTSNYPIEPKDVNLRVMADVLSRFSFIVGLSDHTLDIRVPAIAVVYGAKVIEKHLTLDRNFGGPSPDHKASLEPEELKEMVNLIRSVEKGLVHGKPIEQLTIIKQDPKFVQLVLGKNIKQPTPEEIDVAKVVRKSIVAKVDIPPRTIITRDMLAIKRPGTGLPPKSISDIIGKKSKEKIKKDELITWDKIH